MWSRSMRLGLKKLSCAVDLIDAGVVRDGFERSPAITDLRLCSVRNRLVRHEVFGHTLDEVVVSPLDNGGVVSDFKVN